MLDYEDTTPVYREVYEREVARYETTPAWRVIKRARIYAKVRDAYADLSGALAAKGARAYPIVTTLRQDAWRNIRRVDGDTVFLGMMISAIVGFVVSMVLMIAFSDTNGKSDEKLPPWASIKGRTVTISPEYLNDPESEEWFGEGMAYDFCDRMPMLDGYPEIKTRRDLPNGGFQFTCKGEHE